MRDVLKRWGWPLAKGVLALVILALIGRQFARDLAQPGLDTLTLRPGWLVLAALLYLLGLSLSATFWHHLLHIFGARPTRLAALRAYFIGMLGKYVPGKAVALVLRGDLVRGPQTRFGIAILTSFYEVLTTMAAGALTAAILFALDPPRATGLPWHPVLTGVLLLALCGIPLLPGVFNRLVGKLAARYDSGATPPLRFITLALGLGMTGVGWTLLGLHAWALLQGVLPEPPPLTLSTWAQLTGSIGLAYVAGFLAVFLPAGVGVREVVLRELWGFLAVPAPLLVAAVTLLRLVWTAAELTAALALLPWRQGGNFVADHAPASIE